MKHEHRHGVHCWLEWQTNKGWQKPLITSSGPDSGLNGTQKPDQFGFAGPTLIKPALPRDSLVIPPAENDEVHLSILPFRPASLGLKPKNTCR
jgi:hypothetical protein